MECLALLEKFANKFYFKKIAYQWRESYNNNELSYFLEKISDKSFDKLEKWSKVQELLLESRENFAKEIFVICGSLYLIGEYLQYINYDLENI
jgi:folylpolyglutamate synthase/dihydropteroate synthase